MANKTNEKFISSENLGYFLSKLSDKFSFIGHKHKKGDITDLVIDSTISEDSTNPIQNKAVKAALDSKADNGHTHNYAGSSSVSGSANSALKLVISENTNYNMGSTTQPIYFKDGVPVATTYTLEKSVPSNAKFTDTVYTHPENVTAGTYRKVTVNSLGHVTAGSNPTIAVSEGGTGATDASGARTNLGVPPTSHASSATSYGVGTGSNYGHVKLSDSTTSTSAASSGIAASPKAVKAVKDLADGAQAAADEAAANSIVGLSVSGQTVTYTKGDGTTDTITTQDTKYTLPTASSTLGGVKTTSTVTSTSGLTACPIISGVPYYKNTTYSLSSFGITATKDELNKLDGVTATTAELNYVDGVTSNIQTQLNGKAASTHTHEYLPLTGGDLSGQLNVSADTLGILTVNRTTASKIPGIGFKHQGTITGYLAMNTSGEFVRYDAEGTNGKKMLDANNYKDYCTPANIGAAATSHGTHVSFTTTKPVVAGTAAVGTATTVSRSDHVHPAQTTVSGNAGSATKLATARTLTIGATGKSFNGSDNVSWTLDEIGAAAASHTHDYLPLSGGDLTANLTITAGGLDVTRNALNVIKLTRSTTGKYAGIQFNNPSGTQGTIFMNESGKLGKYVGTDTTDAIFFLDENNYKTYCTLENIGAAAASHKHAAGDITSGTLAVARGGTGVTSNPSMLVNLGSTTAASVFAASPRPGITGTLGVDNGGTGQTTAKAAANALINALETGTSKPADGDYYVSQYVNGGTTTTTYHRRPISKLWEYMKDKADDVYLPLTGGTLSGALTISNGGINVTGDSTIVGNLTLNNASGNTYQAIISSGGAGRYYTSASQVQIESRYLPKDITDYTKNRTLIRIMNQNDVDNSLQLQRYVNGSYTTYRIYGTHNITKGTAAMTAGTSKLETNCIYLQYE